MGIATSVIQPYRSVWSVGWIGVIAETSQEHSLSNSNRLGFREGLIIDPVLKPHTGLANAPCS